jgi:hypothetical protein
VKHRGFRLSCEKARLLFVKPGDVCFSRRLFSLASHRRQGSKSICGDHAGSNLGDRRAHIFERGNAMAGLVGRRDLQLGARGGECSEGRLDWRPDRSAGRFLCLFSDRVLLDYLG